MSTYDNIESHRGMVFDQVRNAAYAQAIRQAVKPGDTVLDLGAGLGIHGLMAAAAGAREVFLLDPSPLVSLGSEIARVNDVADRIRIVCRRIEDAELPGPVDVIVSAFTGNFLLSEDLLPRLLLARDRFLKPGGTLIPGRARMLTALVHTAAFHAEHIAGWSAPAGGLDFSPVRRFAANSLFFRSPERFEAEFLSAPVCLQEMDFATAANADCRAGVELEVRQGGTCHGLLGWFEMQLGREWLSTGSPNQPTHWSAAFLPLDPPLQVEAGERLGLELDRPEFGEWTWTVSHGAERQRHSTFQSKPADLTYLKKQAAGHVPGLGPRGELARFVLNRMTSGDCTADIIEAVRRQFPWLAERDPQFEQHVRRLLVKWGGEGPAGGPPAPVDGT